MPVISPGLIEQIEKILESRKNSKSCTKKEKALLKELICFSMQYTDGPKYKKIVRERYPEIFQEAIEESLMIDIGKRRDEPKPRIILHIRGGHLQSIQANTPDILIHVLDYDNAYAERDGEFEGEPSKPDEIKRDSELLMEIAEVLEEREKERKKNKS